MKWEAAVELVGRQLEDLARPVPKEFFQGLTGHAAVTELLFDKNAEHRQAVDAAVVHFATEFQWPELGHEQLYLLNLRLLCALDLLNVLLVPQGERTAVPQPQVSRRVLIEWLLNATWNEWRWDTWLKLTALRAHAASDTFYGLEP